MWFMQNVPGVPPIKEGLNPATWMLEVSTPGAEQRTGVDFTDEYKNSQFARSASAPQQVSSGPEGLCSHECDQQTVHSIHEKSICVLSVKSRT